MLYPSFSLNEIFHCIPADTRCKTYVIMTSKRRRNVILTSEWHYCDVCPLGLLNDEMNNMSFYQRNYLAWVTWLCTFVVNDNGWLFISINGMLISPYNDIGFLCFSLIWKSLIRAELFMASIFQPVIWFHVHLYAGHSRLHYWHGSSNQGTIYFTTTKRAVVGAVSV